ncbi:MAG: hypothetical protein HWD83_00455 [Gammaproteobacteria bacterium]|nr:hypothetical protein [Gammaproteobacteria bacterium]
MKKTLLSLSMVMLINTPLVSADWASAIPKLTVEDLEKISEAVSVGLEDQPVGTKVEWSNDNTGSHGSVTLTRLFEVASQECRRIRYQLSARERDNWRIDFDFCKTEDGLWERQPGLIALEDS